MAVEYDPAIHVTAQDLRRQRIPLPLDIPAKAFIRRDMIRAWWEPQTGMALPKGVKAQARLVLECREPFRLGCVLYAIDKKGKIRPKMDPQEKQT